MWGTWLSLGRTMTRYDAATFPADGKHMIANLATIMAVFMISAAVVGLLATWLLFRHRPTAAGWLALLDDLLDRVAPGPMVTLGRIVALSMVDDPGTPLRELDTAAPARCSPATTACTRYAPTCST